MRIQCCRESKLQVPNDSPEVMAKDSFEDRINAQKELVEKLKTQWKLLWSERFNDKVLAEGVSVCDYATLKVERGTVIHATKDFKALSFKEIVEQNVVENLDRVIQPNVQVGGWSKFVKTEIIGPRSQKNTRTLQDVPVKRSVKQPKKGGRGWLHVT